MLVLINTMFIIQLTAEHIMNINIFKNYEKLDLLCTALKLENTNQQEVPKRNQNNFLPLSQCKCCSLNFTAESITCLIYRSLPIVLHLRLNVSFQLVAVNF